MLHNRFVIRLIRLWHIKAARSPQFRREWVEISESEVPVL